MNGAVPPVLLWSASGRAMASTRRRSLRARTGVRPLQGGREDQFRLLNRRHSQRGAAAHVQHLPRHESVVGREEEQRCARHVVGRAHAAHGNAVQDALRLRRTLRVALSEEFSRNRAGADGVDGDALPAGAQRGQERLHQQHGRAQVQAPHVVELRRGGGVDGARARGARVVHQRCHVVLGRNLGRAFAGRCFVGQVSLVRGELRVAPRGQHVVQVDHRVALGQNGLGDGAADAVAGAGDDRDGSAFIHRCHTRSRMMAMPCPTPMHMVHSAYWPACSCRRLTAVVTRRAPLAPRGWPSAMAPPQALTRASSSFRPKARSTARPCAAKASLSSITSMWSMVRPVCASTFRVAGVGPKPMMRGATPATAMPTTRARGLRPYLAALASSASSSAQAPSFTPLALPAVTVPSGRTTPLSLASASRLVSRGCSSWLTMIASPFFCGMCTGTISRARWPALMAATALSWLRRAIWSWASRSILKSVATFSAVSGMESTPYFSFISLLMKRQPMVVSYTALLRLKADSALGMTKGARLMLSPPPAIIRPASPALMARAAVPTASRPEPHRRLMVAPGTSIGKPASRLLMWATLRLSSPAWLAQP